MAAAGALPPHQKAFGSPARLSVGWAQWRDLILASTMKRRLLVGLYQISWSPLPWRSKRQPARRSNFLTAGVKLSAIQAATGARS